MIFLFVYWLFVFVCFRYVYTLFVILLCSGILLNVNYIGKGLFGRMIVYLLFIYLLVNSVGLLYSDLWVCFSWLCWVVYCLWDVVCLLGSCVGQGFVFRLFLFFVLWLCYITCIVYGDLRYCVALIVFVMGDFIY